MGNRLNLAAAKAVEDGGASDDGRLCSLLADMSATRDRDHLVEAACRALGETTGLNGAWMVAERGGRVGAEGEWICPSGRSHRLAAGLLDELYAACCEQPEAAFVPASPGRQATLSIPIAVRGELQGVLVGAARGARTLPAWALDRARLVGAHTAACLEMVMTVQAVHEVEQLAQAAELAEGVQEQAAGAQLADRLEMLHSVSSALVKAHSELEVGKIVVRELRRVIDYHSCRFYTPTADGSLLRALAHLGFSELYEDDRVEDLDVNVGDGITGSAFVKGEAFRTDDARELPQAVTIPGSDPDLEESMLVAPMIADTGPIGVIVLSKEGLAQFDDEDLRLLRVIAAQAAVACESARLATEQREALEGSEALLDLGNALALQTSVDGVARMLPLTIVRLIECAGVSVWWRDQAELVLASLEGYTPREQQRLTACRLAVESAPFGRALNTKRVTVAGVDETPALAGLLDAAPAGTTFTIVPIGERLTNRGAIVVQRGPRRGKPSERDELMLLGIADQALLAITNRSLIDELNDSFLATVEALANALDAKDAYTGDHAKALVEMCTEVAGRLGMSGTAVRDVSFAAALHDIGKIGIPQEILNKPGKLTVEEFEIMKQHPELGARIIEPVQALHGARELVLACHEHFDGAGYPLGLQGEEIPLGARVILACDAYHAMTTDRVYRKAMSTSEAIAELRRCAGSHFDPEVVDCLVAVVARASG